MSDLYDKVTDQQDIFKKIASKIPGFSGYIERQNRRAADKLLRESVAARYEELHKKLTELQQDLARKGEITVLDDLETAATKLRTFIDKIRTASYGYSGFFDAVKVNEEEIKKLYEFDASMLDLVDAIDRAIDNVAASVGTDGLPAAISHLVTLARELVTSFEQRDQVITSMSSSE
jgi:DNA-directed RNA polymerase beta' subunit